LLAVESNVVELVVVVEFVVCVVFKSHFIAVFDVLIVLLENEQGTSLL
jgi:hypothetical protein